MLVQVLAAPLPVQLPGYGLGKQWRMSQPLGPYTHMGDLEEAPGIPGFGLLTPQSGHYGHLGSRWNIPVLLPCSLWFCLSNKNKVLRKYKCNHNYVEM